MKALGKEGVILEVDSDGNAVVMVGANLWLFNPKALEDLTDGEASVRRNDTPAGSTVTPLEINLRGPRALEAYNKALTEGQTRLKRIPIMLIGQDRSGKTSLKKSLQGLRFNPEENSTEGIDVDPSYFKVTTEPFSHRLNHVGLHEN